MQKNWQQDFFKFLSFPSVSTDPARQGAVVDCAQWLAQWIQRAGLAAEVRPTAGHPVVLANNEHIPGRKTVLLYGHYDVQPPDPLELWKHPPFEPALENGVVYARGASDNKGQIFSHLLGLQQTLASAKELPVNLIVLVEGEEEIGSPHLTPFLEKHRDSLACDVIIVSDTTMIAPNTPTLTYGMRGLAALEVRVHGPSQDLHSGGFGGAIVNPVTVLARMLGSLHDRGWHVAIEGFYQNVQPLQAWEKSAWAALPLDEKELRRLSGAPVLDGETGFTALERLWARPTAEINGIGGGYQGPGTKTILPSSAFAKLTFRLVPNQDPEKILDAAVSYFESIAPSSVRVEILRGHSGKPYWVDPHGKWGQAAQQALRETFNGQSPALIREGGSIPILSDFKRVLGADTLLLGLALPDCNMHAPNESFPLSHLEVGARLNQTLLRHIAGA